MTFVKNGQLASASTVPSYFVILLITHAILLILTVNHCKQALLTEFKKLGNLSSVFDEKFNFESLIIKKNDYNSLFC